MEPHPSYSYLSIKLGCKLGGSTKALFGHVGQITLDVWSFTQLLLKLCLQILNTTYFAMDSIVFRSTLAYFFPYIFPFKPPRHLRTKPAQFRVLAPFKEELSLTIPFVPWMKHPFPAVREPESTSWFLGIDGLFPLCYPKTSTKLETTTKLPDWLGPLYCNKGCRRPGTAPPIRISCFV
jgi:hypothetical protein